MPPPSPLEAGSCRALFRSCVACTSLLRLRFSPPPPKGGLDESGRTQQLFVFVSLLVFSQSFGLFHQPSTFLDEGASEIGRVFNGGCASPWVQLPTQRVEVSLKSRYLSFTQDNKSPTQPDLGLIYA